MNLAHVHLLLNHLPVLGIPFALALYGLGVVQKSNDLKRASYLFAMLIAVLTVPTYLTGEPAEDLVEGVAGVTEAFIEKHEEPALVSLVLTLMAGALGVVQYFSAAIGARLKFVQEYAGAIRVAYVLALIASSIALGYTAMQGGEIRHTEIRAGALGEGASQGQ